MLFTSRVMLWMGIAVFLVLIISLRTGRVFTDCPECDSISNLWEDVPTLGHEDKSSYTKATFDDSDPYAYDSDAYGDTDEDGDADEDDLGASLTLNPAAPRNRTKNFPLSKLSCAGFPDTSNILLIMKTGASEAATRIPLHALTTLRCLPDFLIYSDMEQRIAGQHILDSLDTVLESLKEAQPEFKLYRAQKECPYDQEICNKGRNAPQQAWALDKYKNIHMAIKAYSMRPKYDWYLFVDADTYISWPTMAEWVKHMNSTSHVYRGNTAVIADQGFAHGGSGYVVSQKTMAAFNKAYVDSLAEKWDVETSQTCCGDYMFAKALREVTGVTVEDVKPTLDGAGTQNVRFGPKWCQPVASLHHVGHESLFAIDEFERERKYSDPLLFRDVFFRFVRPHLNHTRNAWDNEGDRLGVYEPQPAGAESEQQDPMKALEAAAPTSVDQCQRLCQEQRDCLTFKHEKNKCSTFVSVQIGEAAADGVVSGWLLDRIDQWDFYHKCGEIRWP